MGKKDKIDPGYETVPYTHSHPSTSKLSEHHHHSHHHGAPGTSGAGPSSQGVAIPGTTITFFEDFILK